MTGQAARAAAAVSSPSSTHPDLAEPPSPGALAAVILAAGQGTRMRSRRHKVLHPLGGRPLILRVLDLVSQVGAEHLIVVLGHQAEQVQAVLPPQVATVIQMPQLGTGHAVQVAAPAIRATGAERLLVHYGDEALVRPASLERLLGLGVGPASPIALLDAEVPDPSGYGRVLRRPDGSVEAMVEEVDASPAQRAVREIWSGSLLVWTPWLWNHLDQLPLRPKGEYYLPDVVNIARRQQLGVQAALVADAEEVYGVNDRLQLAEANAILRQRTLEALMRAGVTILDPTTTFVEPEVEIAADVTLQPGCHLRGRTRIEAGAEIGPNSYVVDSTIGADSRVWLSVLEGARVGRGVSIGPFSHLRPGAVVEDGANLGNYAEVKASRIGAGTQMHHFSYVGDADVGEGVNIAAGTITANFNGETGRKSRTIVERAASLGSDTLLVAPVHVGEGAMTGAGAVVTHDVPAGEIWLGAPARPYRRRAGYTADGTGQPAETAEIDGGGEVAT